jgi:acylphosphatase
MPTVSAIVTGRVQGVGFRAFVVRIAESLEVCGEVWNRSEGAVEMIAQHESDEVLDSFIGKLDFGPGRVDKVLHSRFETTARYDSFDIGMTR